MVSRGKGAGGGPIYQLKVTLEDFRPTIWRQIQVPGIVDLWMLHEVLQVTMGWANYHLWQFTIDGGEYGEPSPADWYPVEDAGEVRLSQVARGEGVGFSYTYDFGDNWEHEILVEKVFQADPEVRYPVCIAGERACPPEDCGGVWGYADLIEIIQDPEHEEHQEMAEWVGDDFNPEAFDLEGVNETLEYFRPPATGRRRRRRRR
ncbi:MAG: hypothetical protein MAG451_01237 [Anaerolineales bacterium]|nr:hypothetical protein [Anaerolineales bacterium]